MRLYIFFSSFMLFLACDSSDAQLKIVPAFPNATFSAPVDIQSAYDGSDRLFVVSQPGIISFLNINDPNSEPAEFLDIQNKVQYGGEQGLLGLAFHPDYKTNGYFFVDYVAGNPRRTVIARYSVSKSEPGIADPNSELILLEIKQPYSNHNGGQIVFGPDGYLYIGMGDGGSGGDPENRAQNPDSLLGKILRIDVNSSTPGKEYSIPSDNPYSGNSEGHAEEIFAIGLRNPWRFSFDTTDDKLWCADVGQNKYEEIDIIENGKNYGWRIMEGFHCYDPSSGCDQNGLELPIHEYEHNEEGGYSITGGRVYRGTKLPSLIGKYIYADFVSGKIWALNSSGNTYVNEVLFNSNYSIPTFGTDENNELYFSSFTDGKIYKFEDDVVGINKKDGKLGYKLFKNYPNPFNPATKIQYQVLSNKYIALKVYNSLGEEIKTLVNEIQPAGNYEVDFNAAGLKSGVYFCRLTTDGNFNQVIKMLLVK